jgi:tryptophanyl-tRNA synthetase
MLFDQNKKTIISGITCTGNLTLGHYLGIILDLKKYQEDRNYQVFIFLADLHALTNKNLTKEGINYFSDQILMLLLASGINFNKVFIYRQSSIPAHCQLMHIFLCHLSLSQLMRMTQFKHYLSLNQNNYNFSSGLLTYPALMAADILLYNFDYVLVGKDQLQHLELTNDIARSLNKLYSVGFKLVQPIINQVTKKIMALKNPESKMSKSDQNQMNTIFLLDDQETITKKIQGSKTDSDQDLIFYDSVNKPGISNLISIYSALKQQSISDSEKELKDFTYDQFKKQLIFLLNKTLKEIQDNYFLIKQRKKEIMLNLEKNNQILNQISEKNLFKIMKSLNLI